MSKSEKAPPPWQAWSVTVLVVLGAAVGGCGVIFGWPMFWTGVGIVGFGVLLGWAVHVLEFTEEYEVGQHDRTEPGTKRAHG
jgi:hypothetical protein